MRSFLAVIFLLLNFLYFAQDSVYTIKNIQVNFLIHQPKELIRTSDYVTVRNDSIKKIILSYISSFTNKYPGHILDSCLNRIYVCDQYKFRGVRLGGQGYSKEKFIILAIPYESMNQANYWYWMERLFHHELAHMIHDKYMCYFDKINWENENSTKYFKHHNKNLRKQKNIHVYLDTTQLKLGFVNQYARNNFKEDFAVFSEFMFTPEPGFQSAVSKYIKASNKYKLLLQFYHKIDDRYTDSYFKSLQLSAPSTD